MTAKAKLLFDQVVSIKPLGRKQCYDFEIPIHHNFFANEVLVHNSGGIEENADIVMIGSRQGYEKAQPSTEISADCDYDLWIAKHRRGPESKISLTFRPPCFEFLEPTSYGAARHPSTDTRIVEEDETDEQIKF